MNTYIPTVDPQTQDFDDSDLLAVLRELTIIIDGESYTDIVLNGDLNWDPGSCSGFSSAMTSFDERVGLVPLWKHHDVNFTHVHTDYTSTSVLDHFLVNERLHWSPWLRSAE